jgi:hypothetical protein
MADRSVTPAFPSLPCRPKPNERVTSHKVTKYLACMSLMGGLIPVGDFASRFGTADSMYIKPLNSIVYHSAWHPFQALPWGRLGLMSPEDHEEQAKPL